ncbi:FAD/NAD(P)-binding protein [Stenotrophomonas sp. HITSZ_GD]|uniref:FAD/NAD(P)-binding protein n=1 Tax=Stenotrophomonas sp. HITSZ_GD TaxID=3037248 RepID=UPI00240DFBC5|nr:FAD/NAD(P)-binding protein [Stenotrophomonas sp. HITSZ_GD]MDG2525358.1 FAD/NAD(P)-binding protein [Stenotrophomonas sp. HITSZ_GD]
MPSFPQTHDIAVIGGGASGVMVALQLLRHATGPLRIALIEPQPILADGVAYATRRPEHLLNVPAGKMSAFPEQPGDFVDYLRAVGALDLPAEAIAPRYMPRLHYGAYLRERLAQAQAASPATLEVFATRVTSLSPQAGSQLLHLHDGGSLVAAEVVLAVGNALRPLPLRGATALAAAQRVEAWDTPAVAAIPAEAAVAIIGSGLSMVDAVVTLAEQGHRGAIHVISRHGLMPLPHADAAPFDFDPEPLLALPLRARMRALRAQVARAAAQGQPWQAVMERIRPLGQALWRRLSQADQRRFLRHGVRYWDVHRHRIDACIHARLQSLRDAGQLRLHRSRVDTAWTAGACVRIEGREHDGAPLRLEVQRVINATGVEMRVQAMRNPLLQQLVGEGVAAPGPHGIGLDSDDAGRVLDAAGHAHERLHVMGSLRIGTLWESLAVPELRAQAAALAGTLLASR